MKRCTLLGHSLAIASLFSLVITISVSAAGQTFAVLHTFTGGADGSAPDAGLAIGPSGVLYGTTTFGGTHRGPDCCGTVFKLNHVNSGWIFSPLFEFFDGVDGFFPVGGVTIGPNGALFGTTSFGGSDNFGAVFELRPPPTACAAAQCLWNETVLHSFVGPPDGGLPQSVYLVFDQSGNIYGTTYYGGAFGYGIVFELTPSSGGYTESVIHSFNFGDGGTYPNSGVVLDTAGNLYGTTQYGGAGTECMDNCGTVYQLVPSDGSWTENVLINFNFANGDAPLSNPIVDPSGNLYGTAGTVYKLTRSGEEFTYTVISNLDAVCGYQSALARDAAGNLFGVCDQGPGADGYGWVFELTNCSHTCSVIDLHDFTGGADGASPLGTPVLDASGNLYGTASQGAGTCNFGINGCGTVWEITGVGAPLGTSAGASLTGPRPIAR